MTCIPVKNGILCLAKTDFKCPHCDKAYSDENGIYTERCNKNYTGCTRIKCECGKTFYMTCDITGKAVSFE